jgi:RNA polymerase sigma-70 factor, ECF subfamily
MLSCNLQVSLHLFPPLDRISVSMNAAACYFVNGMESETSAIARGLRRRDPDLLDRLVEQYQHRLLRYLIYLTSNRELAEDMFQETWIRVLERGHQYDPKYEFSTWLLSIARHLTVDYLRKKRPASLDGLLDEEEGVSLDPPDLRPSALELIAQEEQSSHPRRLWRERSKPHPFLPLVAFALPALLYFQVT